MTQKTIIMPKPYLKKWLKALRSGKYKQGAGTLFNVDKETFCCLGVLQAEIDKDIEIGLDEYGHFKVRNFPSEEWLEAHGIEFFEDNGSSTINPYLPELADLAGIVNDSGKCNFKEIADAIEACAEGYDV